MISPQQNFNEAVEKRYLRLAGPFHQEEESLFNTFVGYLQKTGARIVTVRERDGINVWRLRSECETHEETAARLHKKI